MLRMSRKLDYGLLVLSHLVGQGPTGASARDIAERFGISQAFVANVLKALAQSGLVRSFRGVHGGYTLARAPARITMLDVLGALEGPFAWAECSQRPADSQRDCELVAVCPVCEPIKNLHHRIEELLRSTTLADITGATVAGQNAHTLRATPGKPSPDDPEG